MCDIEWLTIAEACRALKVSRRTLYTYMETRKLDFHQIGGTGHRRIKAEEIRPELDAALVSLVRC